MINIEISRVEIKQITFHNVGGPHTISLKDSREKTEVTSFFGGFIISDKINYDSFYHKKCPAATPVGLGEAPRGKGL